MPHLRLPRRRPGDRRARGGRRCSSRSRRRSRRTPRGTAPPTRRRPPRPPARATLESIDERRRTSSARPTPPGRARWTHRSPGRKAASTRCPGFRSPWRRAAARRGRRGPHRAAHRARVLVPAQAPRLHAALPPAGACRATTGRSSPRSRRTASRTSRPAGTSSSAASRPTRGDDVSRELAQHLACAGAAQRSCKVHGARSACTAPRPTCGRGRGADGARARARDRRPGARDVRAAVAQGRVRQLRARRRAGRDDPAGLHRIGTLAEATRRARARSRRRSPRSARRTRGSRLSKRCSCSSRSRARRTSAYADARGEPLARWFALARKGVADGIASSAACWPPRAAPRHRAGSMSAPGRSQRELPRSAQREGSPMSTAAEGQARRARRRAIAARPTRGRP